jgi:hypothetical protein
VTSCAVCTTHMETRSVVEPQNQGLQFVSGLASKSLGRFLPVQPQKWWYGLASKPVAKIFLVWPQNQGRRFPGLGLKTGSCDLVIWASKSPCRFLGLGLKTMRATVCQLRHKTDGRESAWDTL